ncbi:hypothetical protein KAJ27_12440 [bacterium]|nr:hypothetical protein [bacterium]
MENVLHHILFSEKMRNALFGKDKKFNMLLSIVKSFEQGNWNNKIFAAMSGKAIESKFSDYYLESVKMANSFF